MTATAMDVIVAAASQIGYQSTSTRSKFTDWYGFPGYWCAMFVSWCAAQANATDIIPRHSYTVDGADWFKNRGAWQNGLSGSRAGDIVYFDFNVGRISHVGIVEANNGDGTIMTIEGNTSAVGSQRAGGAVARKTRRADVVGYGRPAYAALTTAPALPTAPQYYDEEDTMTYYEALSAGSAGFVQTGWMYKQMGDGPFVALTNLEGEGVVRRLAAEGKLRLVQFLGNDLELLMAVHGLAEYTPLTATAPYTSLKHPNGQPMRLAGPGARTGRIIFPGTGTYHYPLVTLA